MRDHVIERRLRDPEHAPYMNLLRSKVSWAGSITIYGHDQSSTAMWADCQVLKCDLLEPYSMCKVDIKLSLKIWNSQNTIFVS